MLNAATNPHAQEAMSQVFYGCVVGRHADGLFWFANRRFKVELVALTGEALLAAITAYVQDPAPWVQATQTKSTTPGTLADLEALL